MILSFYVRAKVRKLATDNGRFRLTGDLAVGDVVIVDLYTKHRPGTLIDEEIDFIQSMETGGWLPLECVQLYA